MKYYSHIKLLKNTDLDIAESIYQLFQASYTVEAKLLKIDNFPPLNRSISNIQSSKTQFWAYYVSSNLAAIAEIELVNPTLDIHSFVVSPTYFRQGIGSNLLEYLLTNLSFESAVVETASVNKPAIALYKKMGFIKEKIFVNGIGIKKVMLIK